MMMVIVVVAVSPGTGLKRWIGTMKEEEGEWESMKPVPIN